MLFVKGPMTEEVRNKRHKNNVSFVKQYKGLGENDVRNMNLAVYAVSCLHKMEWDYSSSGLEGKNVSRNSSRF